MDPYLSNLADDGDTIIEPRDGWRLTALEDGAVALEFLSTHLAVKIPGPNALTDLEAAIEEARGREAEMEIDDASLWPIDAAPDA